MSTKTVPTAYQQCTNRQKQSKDSKTAKMTLVYQSSHVYQVCTNSVATVYQSLKPVKTQSKQQKWPLVYQSSHVYSESAEYTKYAFASASASAYASAKYTKPYIAPVPSSLWTSMEEIVRMDASAKISKSLLGSGGRCDFTIPVNQCCLPSYAAVVRCCYFPSHRWPWMTLNNCSTTSNAI